MQVSGQPQVLYGYDNAHRWITIIQGSGSVTITYDDADRRSTVTLPNGVVVDYDYDDANQLAGLTYLLSGNPIAALVAFCRGVDVLIHEVIDLDVLRQLVSNQQRVDAIVARHTTPEQAAGIFSRVSPRLAVFSHSPGTPAIVEQTKRSYSGRVEMGTDLMVIDIGDQVHVRPGAAEVRPR
jgi:YD repeat-containing protein